MITKLERAIPVFLAVAAMALVLVLIVPGVSHAKAKPKVDCTTFNPVNITISQTSSGYAITEQNRPILQIGESRPEARLALHLMQHYSMSRNCRVTQTKPAFTFFKSGKTAPLGAVAGEDCVGFNPKKVKHVKRGSEFVLVDGGHSIVVLGTNQRAAKKVRETVQELGFRNICYIGRPDPSMVYFRR